MNNNIAAEKCAQGGGKCLRLKYIDVAKLIAISAVVFDHSQYYVPIEGNWFSFFRIFLFGFFLQIFFFTAGLVNAPKPLHSLVNWKTYIEKLFRSIIVPYLIWSLILGTRVDTSFLTGVLKGTQTSLSSSGTDSVLWFLPALFCSKVCYQLIVEVMFACFKKISKVFEIVVAALLAVLSYNLGKFFDNRIVWGLDIGLMGTALMLAGHLLRGFIDEIQRAKFYKQIILFVLCLTGAVLFAYTNMPLYLDESGAVVYRAAVWMARGMYGQSCILFVANSLFSCVMVLIVSFWLSRFSALASLGQHTLAIMTVHGKIYVFIAQMVTVFRAEYVPVVAAFATILLCIPVVYFINRFAPVLEGKYDKK